MCIGKRVCLFPASAEWNIPIIGICHLTWNRKIQYSGKLGNADEYVLEMIMFSSSLLGFLFEYHPREG